MVNEDWTESTASLSLLSNGHDIMFEPALCEPPLVDENPYPDFAWDLIQTTLDPSVKFEKFSQRFFQLSHSSAFFGIWLEVEAPKYPEECCLAVISDSAETRLSDSG